MMFRKLRHLPNLDFLRAIAILMVLFLHITANFTTKLNLYSGFGRYGVELFFVLSGFLVGCLFFNERHAKGNVNILNFILRRVSRTLPPYFIVLIPAFLSVWFFKQEKFDFKYLFFIQNYIEKIPFYKVSWSICVEEHFYLILPFILLFLFKLNSRAIQIVLILVFLFSSLFFRIIEINDLGSFGYYQTASHFHFDSMICGVIAAWLYTFKDFKFILGSQIFAISLSLSILVLSFFIGDINMFIYGKLFLSMAFSLLVLMAASVRQFSIGKSKLFRNIALSSYATYLTHPILINVLNLVLFKDYLYLNMILVLFLTLLVGFLFYIIVEKKIMVFRDRYVPKVRDRLYETK